MPIPISALKMADSKKFAVLAEPLGQPSDAQARPVLDLKGAHAHVRALQLVAKPRCLGSDTAAQAPTQCLQVPDGIDLYVPVRLSAWVCG